MRTMKIARSGRAKAPVEHKQWAQMFAASIAPPGVPDDALIAMDNALEPIFGYAQQGFYGEGVVWLGFPYLAELTQRPEYRVISEVRAKEMTRKGFELTYADKGKGEKVGLEKGENRLAELDQACKDFKLLEHLRAATEHDGFFGGGHIYLDVCDPDDRTELALPLKIDKAKITKGGLKGFKTIEPMWMYPANYNSADPLHPHFFKPQHWYVNGKQVHKTRILTLISREVPDIIKPAYSFRGLSLSQMAKPYVDNWLRTRQSVSDITHSFSVMVLASILQSQVQGAGDWGTIYDRVDEFNALRDNRGTFVIDKDTEEMTNVSAPLGTLDALQAQSQEQLCSVSQTPTVKLLGIQPAGLNASSDGEIRVFYDMIHAQQEHIYTDPLKIALDCIQLHLWGEIDQAIGFKFISLWELDEAAQASVRKTQADTDAVYVEMGALGPDEVRMAIAADKDSPYASIEVEDMPERPEDEGQTDTSGEVGKVRQPQEELRSGV